MSELTPWKISKLKKVELMQLAAQYPDIQVPESGQVRQFLVKALTEKIRSGQQPTEPAAPIRTPGNKQLFDELTAPGTEVDLSADSPIPKETRGGPRPGAGRKPGVTAEMSRIDNLSTEPNRTVIYFTKWIFKVWAGIADCKEIALDEDELKEFATDTTQFLEYHGIKIPQGMAVDSKFILGGCELFGGRAMMHKAYKARMKKQAEKQEQEEKHV